MFKMNGSWIICVLLVGLSGLITLSHAQQSFGECVTPFNERGTCMALRDCTTKDGLTCCKSSLPVVPPFLLPTAPNCGKYPNIGPQKKIVGGQKADPRQFPWMALLQYERPVNVRHHDCGGSLINNRYVVTAAHCVIGLQESVRLTGVRLGEWDRSTTTDCYTRLNNYKVCNPPHIDVPISEIIVHEQYPDRQLNNDIALLRLQYPVTYSDSLSPICLPINANQRNSIYLRRRMEVAGWGSTWYGTNANIKQRADVYTKDLRDCNKKYFTKNLSVSEMQICAGGDEGVNACMGDCGSPLMVLDESEHYYLAGLLSYGPYPCDMAGWPTVYTRVGQYMDWILSHIKP